MGCQANIYVDLSNLVSMTTYALSQNIGKPNKFSVERKYN